MNNEKSLTNKEKIELFISTDWEEILKEELHNRSYTIKIKDIANGCGISHTTVHNVMKGQYNCTMQTITDIFKFLQRQQ